MSINGGINVYICFCYLIKICDWFHLSLLKKKIRGKFGTVTFLLYYLFFLLSSLIILNKIMGHYNCFPSMKTNIRINPIWFSLVQFCTQNRLINLAKLTCFIIFIKLQLGSFFHEFTYLVLLDPLWGSIIFQIITKPSETIVSLRKGVS